jgi:hypothetical protein
MSRIAEINAMIGKLQQERTDIINAENFKNTEEIKSLKWTKDCDARLHIESGWSTGLSHYKIFIFGKTPEFTNPINVMGESSLYEYNVLFGKDFMNNSTCFYTSSKETLLKFMEHVEFRNFTYDINAYEILAAAKKKAEKLQQGNS